MTSNLSLEQAVGQRLLLAFKGREHPSDEIVHALRTYRPAGITLFRPFNIDHPAQLRSLNDQLQSMAREIGLPPLIIAADQEGGQLMAIGEGATPLPGNMALGATGSPELAGRAGEVLGRELAAMGVNLNYAPVADVNINPRNPAVGIRSFGEDPADVARFVAAMIEGIQSQGVVATAKHFPGHGDTTSDSHHGLPSVPHSLDRLHKVELLPFQAAIQAGVKAIMTAHLALPALDGPDAPPATLSGKVLTGLLRRELGFDGVIITDAMDMRAIRQGEFLGGEAIRAVHAGADLLLLTTDPEDQRCVHEVLTNAAKEGVLNRQELVDSADRILALKEWLAGASTPDLSVVGCQEHLRVADEIAERSITLVRDDASLLPLQLPSDARIAVVIPMPQDLTPADTSSYVHPALAASLRRYHSQLDEFVLPYAPAADDISRLIKRLGEYRLVIVGTLNAHSEPRQAELVHRVVKTGIRTIVVAMRLPYDLAAFPEVATYICTYGILEPSMRALAQAVFGHAPIKGHLPVGIPGLYAAGHYLSR